MLGAQRFDFHFFQCLNTSMLRLSVFNNAAAREHGLSYSRFISGLKEAGVEVDRKVLADIAMHEKDVFAALVEKAKAA